MGNDHDLLIQVATTQTLMAEELRLMRRTLDVLLGTKADLKDVDKLAVKLERLTRVVDGIRRQIWIAIGIGTAAVVGIDYAFRLFGK